MFTKQGSTRQKIDLCAIINELRHLNKMHTKQKCAYSGALEHCHHVYAHFMSTYAVYDVTRIANKHVCLLWVCCVRSQCFGSGLGQDLSRPK